MESIKDLFNVTRFLHKGAVLNERAGAIKYFVDTFNLNPKRLAPKLAHLNVDLLYTLQSEVKDRISRQDLLTARKYFWWAVKTTVVAEKV